MLSLPKTHEQLSVNDQPFLYFPCHRFGIFYKVAERPVFNLLNNFLSITAVDCRVTISWYDPPNVQGTTTAALVQNLDLSVTSPSGTTYWGNGGANADILNTNEQVYIDNPEEGDWRVQVSSQALPYAGYQKFSIVITTAAGSVSYV